MNAPPATAPGVMPPVPAPGVAGPVPVPGVMPPAAMQAAMMSSFSTLGFTDAFAYLAIVRENGATWIPVYQGRPVAVGVQIDQALGQGSSLLMLSLLSAADAQGRRTVLLSMVRPQIPQVYETNPFGILDLFQAQLQ